VKFFQVSLFLVAAARFSGVCASASDNKLRQPQQISVTSNLKDKFNFLHNLQDQQTAALKDVEEISDLRARLDKKMRIASDLATAVIQTADRSTNSGVELQQRAQKLMKDDKDQAVGLQSLYLKFCCCCPEKNFQELPTQDYVEKADQLMTKHLLNLHEVYTSKKISMQDRF
jgi:hypothetical protein